MKKFRQKISPKKIGVYFIIYGIIFEIIDILHYYSATASDMSYMNSGIMGLHFYCEPVSFKIVNLIFSLLIIISGFNIKNKKQKAWFLFQIAFVGIIIKPFVLIYVFFSKMGIFYFVHFIIAILGIIYTNNKRSELLFGFEIKNKKSQYILILGIVTIIMLILILINRATIN